MKGMARIVALLSLVALAACGGGGGGGGVVTPPAGPNLLTVADVEKVIAQAVAEAQAQNAKATIAVVDRVGNVLGVFQMNGAASTFTITSGTARTADSRASTVCRPNSRRSRWRSPARICPPRAMRSPRAPRARSSRITSIRGRATARRAAVRRAVQPAHVLRPDHGIRPTAPSAPSRRRSASPPSRADCRCTRTAPWSAHRRHGDGRLLGSIPTSSTTIRTSTR